METESEYKIPLYNISKELTGYAIVDETDYEDLLTGKWYMSTNGYVNGSIGTYTGFMHKYLVKKYKVPKKNVVDHINHNRLDNRMDNLRPATHSQNAQNRKKIVSKETTSKYIGVHRPNKQPNIWQMTIRIPNNKKIYHFFDNEIWAAYCYDKYALEIYGPDAKINGIEMPENFAISSQKTYRKGCSVKKRPSGRFYGTFYFQGKEYGGGTFDTEEEVITSCENKKRIMIKEYNKNHKNKEITRNGDNVAVINIISNGVTYECLVDDDKWHELTLFNWSLGAKQYIQRSQDNKRIHHYLMNIEDSTIVDHKDGNPLNNQLSNLRRSNNSLNTHNKNKHKNKYVGIHTRVYEKDNKIMYRAVVRKKGEKTADKTFDNEKEAVEWRNEQAKRMYGIHAKLNVYIPE